MLDKPIFERELSIYHIGIPLYIFTMPLKLVSCDPTVLSKWSGMKWNGMKWRQVAESRINKPLVTLNY